MMFVQASRTSQVGISFAFDQVNAVDGTVIEEEASIDESMVAGKAIPVDKSVGDCGLLINNNW